MAPHFQPEPQDVVGVDVNTGLRGKPQVHGGCCASGLELWEEISLQRALDLHFDME